MEKRAERNAKGLKAHATLSKWQAKFAERSTSWHLAAVILGGAYRKAFQRHRKALEDQGTRDQLTLDIIFAVLGVATAGGLSWMKAGGKGFRDLAKRHLEAPWGAMGLAAGGAAKEHFVVDPMKAHVETLLAPVNEHPADYRDSLEKRVLNLNRAHEANWSKAWETLERMAPSDWDAFSHEMLEFKLSLAYITSFGFFGHDTLRSEEQIAQELERRIWAEWAQKNLSTFMPVFDGDTGNVLTVDVEPPTHIKRRFDALGITKAAGSAKANVIKHYLGSYRRQPILRI